MTVDLEFLIQKEGDYEWLPLESLSVEILVGRYQLIAQASEADCPIQVHIRHQYVQDGVWQEVVQQQLLHTDSQGRIEVLPPTFLQHGRWIVSCSPQQEGRFGLSEVDSHCVQLQVLTHDVDLDQEWEFLDQALNLPAEPSVHRADDLKPLFAADINAKTAWNNFAPVAESDEIADRDLLVSPNGENTDFKTIDVQLSSVWEEAAVGDRDPLVSPNVETKDFETIDSNQSAPPSKAAPAKPHLPTLPDIPKNVPPIRFEISPGIILPPELFHPDIDSGEIPLPQLPVFPHMDNWADLSYKELSIALGRLHWSKLDTYGEAIDVDFESLNLQTRFLQNLNQLALRDRSGSANSRDLYPLQHSEPNPEKCKALVPISSEGES